MARNTQVIELDLRSGIQTDDSPLAIGPKLLESDEVGWQPFGLTDELRRRVLAFLPQRDLGQTIFSGHPLGDILAVLALDVNGDFPSGGFALVANPDLGLLQCALYDFLGNVFPVGSTLATQKDAVRSGWMVIWTGIDVTTVFFGHPAFGSIWQVPAPGGAPQLFVPTISPFGSGSLTLDTNLDLTSVSAVALAAGETALATGTWKLQLTGTDINGKETNISDETSGTVVGAGKALQFTVPDFTATYAGANLYAHKSTDPYVLQLNNIRPGVYHLNGNGASSAPPIQSFKLITTGVAANAALPLDATLDPQAISLTTRTSPEKNLSNATYTVLFQARRISDHVIVKSDISAPLNSVNQVITFTTALSGFDQIEVYAKKGTSGSAKFIRLNGAGTSTPLALNTTYHINLSGGFVGSGLTFTGIAQVLTGPTPGAAIPNVIDGLIHLDRFWVLQSPGNGRSTAYYSDPIDKNTFRVTSFVPIPADGTCMFRCNVGSIDPGAASHLLFGTTTSIWVLDGDPTTGSGVLRRLTFDVGIADKSCVIETSFGAVFLGTDGQFWLIPPGATQTIPLGHRMLTQHFNADFTTARSSLAWLSPYLVYSDNSGDVWFADLSPLVSQGEPKWWGPVSPTPYSVDTNADVGAVPDVVRLFGTTPEAGPSFSNSVFYGFTVEQISQLDVITRGTTGTLIGRSAAVRSGFLSVEDHKVELRRVVVETTSPDTDYQLQISAITTKGTIVTTTRTVSAVADTEPNILTKTVFDFSSSPVVGDAFMLLVAWPEAISPDTHRAYAEVRLQPKQDS